MVFYVYVERDKQIDKGTQKCRYKCMDGLLCSLHKFPSSVCWEDTEAVTPQ